MTAASGLVKHHHVLTVIIFLTVAVLVAGAAACDGAGAPTYELTISSGSGGNVSNPGEGTFTYPAGSVVQLLGTPDGGYQFLSWTGDVAHIANPIAASTSITLNGNYAIVANFGTEAENGHHEQ